MLMSDAVDQSVSRIDFRVLSGKKAFLDTTYLRPSQFFGQIPSQLQGFVNADYVVSSLRQHLFAAHCELVDDKTQAEIIIEPRIGTLATNGHDMVYGLPQTNALSQAATTLTGAAALPAIPEISVGRSNSQFGLAKIAVFAYDRETKEPVWQSGTSKSESTAKNAWFMGAGPFRTGTIYQGRRFAGTTLSEEETGPPDEQLPIPFESEHVFQNPKRPTSTLDPNAPLSSSPAATTANSSNANPATIHKP